jgi:hypothetical protein
MEVEHATR